MQALALPRTRHDSGLPAWSLSPRACLRPAAWQACAWAWLDGRDMVMPDDVGGAASRRPPSPAHRAAGRHVSAEDIARPAAQRLHIPRARLAGRCQQCDFSAGAAMTQHCPSRLGQRRSSSWPTARRLLFAVVLAVMLLGAINYNLALPVSAGFPARRARLAGMITPSATCYWPGYRRAVTLRAGSPGNRFSAGPRQRT